MESFTTSLGQQSSPAKGMASHGADACSPWSSSSVGTRGTDSVISSARKRCSQEGSGAEGYNTDRNSDLETDPLVGDQMDVCLRCGTVMACIDIGAGCCIHCMDMSMEDVQKELFGTTPQYLESPRSSSKSSSGSGSEDVFPESKKKKRRVEKGF